MYVCVKHAMGAIGTATLQETATRLAGPSGNRTLAQELRDLPSRSTSHIAVIKLGATPDAEVSRRCQEMEATKQEPSLIKEYAGCCTLDLGRMCRHEGLNSRRQRDVSESLQDVAAGLQEYRRLRRSKGKRFPCCLRIKGTRALARQPL